MKSKSRSGWCIKNRVICHGKASRDQDGVRRLVLAARRPIDHNVAAGTYTLLMVKSSGEYDACMGARLSDRLVTCTVSWHDSFHMSHGSDCSIRSVYAMCVPREKLLTLQLFGTFRRGRGASLYPTSILLPRYRACVGLDPTWFGSAL